MKEILSKTWVKVLLIVSIFFGGLLLVGECEKANAANFEYYNTETGQYEPSLVEYDTNKSFNYSTSNSIIIGSKTFVSTTYYVMKTSKSSVTMYTYCNLIKDSSVYLECAYSYSMDPTSSGSITSATSGQKFTINYDYISVSSMFGSDNYYISYTHDEYIEYGEQQFNAGSTASYQDGFDDGVSSVDITADNQEAINNYIEVNNMLTRTEANELANQRYEEALTYAYSTVNEKSASYTAGQESVDITTDNLEYANQYITDNNYHTNEDYLAYGEEQKQIGIESVDITTDNLEYALQYIEDNNYYTGEQVMEYYNKGQKDILNNINSYIILNYDEYYSKDYTCEGDDCSQAVANYNVDIFNYGYNSFDVDQYIIENNYHSNEEYLNYGDANYTNGKYFGYNYLMDEIIEWLYKRNQQNAYIHLLNYHVDMTESNINEYANGFEGIHEVNKIEYMATLENIENVGYVQAIEDSDAFLGLIPTTLGAVVSNIMPILTYEVYGISLMNLIGLIAIIGIAIIIVKFIVG